MPCVAESFELYNCERVLDWYNVPDEMYIMINAHIVLYWFTITFSFVHVYYVVTGSSTMDQKYS